MSSFAFCLAVAVCSSSVSALRKTWRQHSVGERSSIGIFAVKKWSLEISSRSLCRTLACFLQHFKIQWQGPLNFRSPRCAPSGVLRQTLPDYVNGLHHSPAGWRGVQCFGSSPQQPARRGTGQPFIDIANHASPSNRQRPGTARSCVCSIRLLPLGVALHVQVSAVATGPRAGNRADASSRLRDASKHNQIQTSSEVLKHTKSVLAECPTDRYLVVTQPGVHAADLRRDDGCAMPHLCRAVDDSRIKSRYTVSEVVGSVTGAGVAEYIRSSCAEKKKTVTVNEVALGSLVGKDRAGALSHNGTSIHARHIC